jgi:glycosyltransferase involved in cell wall biosynthesis
MKSDDLQKTTSPLFTVIIPCKDRADYLAHTLRTCMIQNYEPLEVIVSDDGSIDNTREVVEEASRRDSRIRYLSPGAGTGMRDNFEFALRQAKPGFVIALGGDDGLLPDGIKGMHQVLSDTGMDLLAWPAALYSYPQARGSKAQLSINHQKGIRIIDSDRFLSRQAKNLQYASDIESPMFYVKGVASTNIIEKVRRRSPQGRFYSCPTPDGYSGIVLAGEVARYAFSGRPFSIFGLSPASQGLSYLSNDDSAKKSSEIFFKNVFSKSMHGELAWQPYSPLITLMTVDYLLTARDLPGWPGRFPPIDYRQVLLSGIRELAHGLYGDDRIRRELAILNQIAEKHGLGEFFRDNVRRTKRGKKRAHFEGYGINPQAFFLAADAYHILNIFDAAYAAQFLYQVYCDMRLSFLGKIVARSIAYKLRAQGKGRPFPPETEWREINLKQD